MTSNTFYLHTSHLTRMATYKPLFVIVDNIAAIRTRLNKRHSAEGGEQLL
jgi:hypothetical protein